MFSFNGINICKKIFFLFIFNVLGYESYKVSVRKGTSISGLLALSYFSYKYGQKSVVKKLPFVLSGLGVLAGVQNEHDRCCLISGGIFGTSLAYQYRNFIFSRKALPFYLFGSGIGVGMKRENKKFSCGSLGALAIYFLYLNRHHVLFTKKRLLQFLYVVLFGCASYKFFTDYRTNNIRIQITNYLDSKFQALCLFINKVKFSSIFYSFIAADSLKYLLNIKKYNFINKIAFPLSCILYFSLLVLIERMNMLYFTPNWGPIKRPDWYNDAVCLKIEHTKCFYNPSMPTKGLQERFKDHTATLCGRLYGEKSFDSSQLSPKSIASIIGIIIGAHSLDTLKLYEEEYHRQIDPQMVEELKKSIKDIFRDEEGLVEGGSWYWNEYDVKFSKKRFDEVAKLFIAAQEIKADVDSEHFAQNIFKLKEHSIEEEIREWKDKQVTAGRVFDKEVPFDSVLELITYMFVERRFSKDDFQYIFSKEIDMKWKNVLRPGLLYDSELRYIAIHCLYGIFCDTCNISFMNHFKTFENLVRWCSGCEHHTNKGDMYGPMTILEHMILHIKEYHPVGKVRNKLIDLDIVDKSFFASIQI